MSTQTEVKPEERAVLADRVLLSEIERAAYQEGWMNNHNVSKVFEMAWNNVEKLEDEAQKQLVEMSKVRVKEIEDKALKTTNDAVRRQKEVVEAYNGLRTEALTFLDQLPDFFAENSAERATLLSMTPVFAAFEELKTV